MTEALEHPTRDDRGWLPPVLLGAVLLVGVAIRVAAAEIPGHGGDVIVVSRWAERLAAAGPTGFYPGGGSIYPALLYLYWPLGVLLDGEALAGAIKGMATPFDVALGLLLYDLVARRAGAYAGVLAAGLYVLNPAVILAGPVWGQIDSAGTLAFIGTLLATAYGRYGLAGALAVVSGLIKPQFGLVVLPVLVVAGLAWRDGGGWRPLLRVALGGALAYLVIGGPLLLSPFDHLGRVAGVTDIRPEFSVYAPNGWALVFGYETPDTGYALAGGILLLAGLAAAQLPLLRSRDLRMLLIVGALVVFAFYFLPTRVHERYLFPAMAVLAPLAAVSLPVLTGYLAMALAFTLSILYALAATTPFPLSAEWEAMLVTDALVVWMSVVLIVTGVTLVVLLLTGAADRLRITRQPVLPESG